VILRPTNPPAQSTSAFVPAWDAILRTQKQPCNEWLLITQADHAALAGEIARNTVNPSFPGLDAEIIHAISVHDDGWKQVDNPSRPSINTQRLPLSFFEESPADIFGAWKGSIARATQVAPIAGILVSEHFCRIARDFSRAPNMRPEIAQVLTTFVEREVAQQEELREQQLHTANEIRVLVDVLQFFDLLSLYVCCGSVENIAFPQQINQTIFRLRRESDTYKLDPPLFSQPTHFSFKAHKHPAPAAEPVSNISILLL
jgi:hypothetical protein